MRNITNICRNVSFSKYSKLIFGPLIKFGPPVRPSHHFHSVLQVLFFWSSGFGLMAPTRHKPNLK